MWRMVLDLCILFEHKHVSQVHSHHSSLVSMLSELRDRVQISRKAKQQLRRDCRSAEQRKIRRVLSLVLQFQRGTIIHWGDIWRFHFHERCRELDMWKLTVDLHADPWNQERRRRLRKMRSSVRDLLVMPTQIAAVEFVMWWRWWLKNCLPHWQHVLHCSYHGWWRVGVKSVFPQVCL